MSRIVRTRRARISEVGLVLTFALILLRWPIAAQSPSAAIPDPAKAGQAIAARLRNAGPEKSASFDGWMTIVRRDRTNTLPIRSRIEVTSTNWLIRYIAGTNPPIDTLTIVHTPGRPNLYYATVGTNAASLGSPLAAGELFQPFAGSDFWRADLGLDFLAWPSQQQVTHQMRRGRACRVLESRPATANPAGYLRVKSWVDVETDGILRAEAYDARDRFIKEFLLGSFRKVDGVHQLEDMTMRKPDSGEETRIQFDLERPSGP